MGLLPGPAQALLRGKERTYHDTDELSPDECSEVTREDARLLLDILGRPGRESDVGGPEPNFLDAGQCGVALVPPDLAQGTRQIWGGWALCRCAWNEDGSADLLQTAEPRG